MKLSLFLLLVCVFFACEKSSVNSSGGTDISQYKGTASVSQGLGKTTISNLFSQGQRVSPVGTITSTDNKTWTVPAEVHFQNTPFPFALDMYNDYGNKYNTYQEALNALSQKDIVVIDNDGEVFTFFVFADNYFEMYVNGTPVGKDPVPFTAFNSCVVTFKVKKPFSIAMKLVDWEENVGLGTENNQGASHHPGDGGMVGVLVDNSMNIVAVTDATWKAQVFYSAPIKDLACPSESNHARLSSQCSTSGTNDASSFYALHWEVPNDWQNFSFDDSKWPNATTYTNSEIGVDNKKSYTNFSALFDDTKNDAKFIWSTNVILDNLVLVRKIIQ